MLIIDDEHYKRGLSEVKFYTDAQVESRRSGSIPSIRFLDDVQKFFEVVERQLAQLAMEMNSAREMVLGYMKKKMSRVPQSFFRRRRQSC